MPLLETLLILGFKILFGLLLKLISPDLGFVFDLNLINLLSTLIEPLAELISFFSLLIEDFL